jgi:hypothetical protein
MANGQKWDVTVRGRIDNVTDQEEFPELLQAALEAEVGLSVVQLNLPTVPHTTSAIVRVTAISKVDAENQVREVMLRAYLYIARALVGNQAFGWTLSTDAVPGPVLPEDY